MHSEADEACECCGTDSGSQWWAAGWSRVKGKKKNNRTLTVSRFVPNSSEFSWSFRLLLGTCISPNRVVRALR